MVTQSPIEKSPGAEGEERTKNFLPGGQRNALKRFKTDKRIQGNPSPFLWFPLAGLGVAGRDFEKFCSGLESLQYHILQ